MSEPPKKKPRTASSETIARLLQRQAGPMDLDCPLGCGQLWFVGDRIVCRGKQCEIRGRREALEEHKKCLYCQQPLDGPGLLPQRPQGPKLVHPECWTIGQTHCIAMYGGDCKRCHMPIQEGDRITKNAEAQWTHLNCDSIFQALDEHFGPVSSRDRSPTPPCGRELLDADEHEDAKLSPIVH